MADEYPDHPVVDVWAVIADPEIPHGVGQRLVTRQRARRLGLEPEPVPEADKPYLARHFVVACATHDEIVRRGDDSQWAHMSDGMPCQPADSGAGAR